MKADEIRALADDQIQAKIDESREELMNLRFQRMDVQVGLPVRTGSIHSQHRCETALLQN